MMNPLRFPKPSPGLKHYHHRVPSGKASAHEHTGGMMVHAHPVLRGYGQVRSELSLEYPGLSRTIRRLHVAWNPTPKQDVARRKVLLREIEKRVSEGTLPQKYLTGAVWMDTDELEKVLRSNPFTRCVLCGLETRRTVFGPIHWPPGVLPKDLVHRVDEKADIGSTMKEKLRVFKEKVIRSNPFLESLVTGIGLGSGFALASAASKKVGLSNPRKVVNVNPGKKDQLSAKGIYNSYGLASTQPEPKVWIEYYPAQGGLIAQYARWVVLRMGYITSKGGNKMFVVPSAKEYKEPRRLEALTWASARYNIFEWEESPFGSWHPKGTVVSVIRNPIREQIYVNGPYRVEIIEFPPEGTRTWYEYYLKGNWNSGPRGVMTTTLRDMQAHLRAYGFKKT